MTWRDAAGMAERRIIITPGSGLENIVGRRITGFHTDEANDWVAELECGHFQHVRHDPPWINRPWAATAEGRASIIGHPLACKKCDAGAPPDRKPGQSQ